MSPLENIQRQLNAFYESALAEAGFLPEHLEQLSLPHLLCISQEYLDAPLKVMFVGKETNGWYGRLRDYYAGKATIADLLGRYRQQMDVTGGQGAFLKSLDHIALELAGGTRKSIVWANLMKMDWPRGRSDSRNSIDHSAQLREFSCRVLRYEVDLLKPDVILFGSGHGYDRAIKAAFPVRSGSLRLVPRALWRFDIGGIACFRLRHPQARPVAGKFEPTLLYYERAIGLLKDRFAHRFTANPSTNPPRDLLDGDTACSHASCDEGCGPHGHVEPAEPLTR